MPLRGTITLIILTLFSSMGFATHNRAGEITYRQVSELTFEFRVITFTNTKPTSDGIPPADRPNLVIQWGDGTESVIGRIGYYDLPDYYRKNIYVGKHTFPGPFTYEILIEDPNRNEGVENIPNSVTVVFSIKTTLQINPALGYNNTPVLLNPPVDKAAVGRVFIHNPSAYDPDGDSLSYEMSVCTGENGEPIASYQLPPSSNRPIFINETGDLIWDAPTKEGIYNVAFLINEWRNGVKIGQVTRDMQIEVYDTENTPPLFDTIPPKCVVAGNTLNFNVTAIDSANETITLSATGGVFEIANPATFSSTPAKGTVTGTFEWETNCTNIRKQPYQVVFKATDDNAEINLVDQKSVDITVIAPAPENVTLFPTNNSITVNWDPYSCPQNTGFKIYRSTSAFNFSPDICETGVPPYTGFELIQEITDKNATSYLDNNYGQGLPQGFSYCYMVTATFEEAIESKSSLEACTELIRGTPIITNVSVTQHGQANGEIYLAWSKPLDFDTIAYPGPYVYKIFRSQGIWENNFVLIDSLNGLSDTTYLDQNINTIDFPYSYRIEIHNQNGATEAPMTASSIFPEIEGMDKSLQVSFVHNTPWQNKSYVVYRKLPGSNAYDSLLTTNLPAFTDKNLKNNKTYCYRVKSIGGYDLPGIISPIINYSHQNCGSPLDTIPPAAPVLSVASDCETFINQLTWDAQLPVTEIKKYTIYFKNDIESTFMPLDSLFHYDSTSYQHLNLESVSGCYAVTATDSAGNESNFSNVVCIDKCSYYKLPNVFTPNGDNVNDLFIPLTPYSIIDQYVEKIDMKIYSRWGELVFETTDPYIEWTGKNQSNNNIVNPGVYYYVCDVYEKRISGVEPRYLVGFIHIYHNKQKKSSD